MLTFYNVLFLPSTIKRYSRLYRHTAKGRQPAVQFCFPSCNPKFQILQARTWLASILISWIPGQVAKLPFLTARIKEEMGGLPAHAWRYEANSDLDLSLRMMALIF